jgi:hypothetical protein
MTGVGRTLLPAAFEVDFAFANLKHTSVEDAVFARPKTANDRLAGQF